MTEAVLSKVDLPSKDVLANLRGLREEIRTLGTTLKEINLGENPVLRAEVTLRSKGQPNRIQRQ